MLPTLLQRYVLRESLRMVALSFLALTGIIFVAASVELLRSGLSVVQLRELVPFVFAYSLPFALPAAFLVSSVFVFGRLSGANELSAMRASGVPVFHVVKPLLAVAALVCLGTFWLNHFMLPWAMGNVRQLSRVVVARAIRHVGVSYTRFEQKNLLIYVGGLTPDRRLWRNVAVIEFAREYPARVLLAERGHCRVNEAEGKAALTLYDVRLFHPAMDEEIGETTTQLRETQYTLNLLAESEVPQLGLSAVEIALIKACSEQAALHAGIPHTRREIGPWLIFHGGGKQADVWRPTGIVEFGEDHIPRRLLLAAEAHPAPVAPISPARGDAPAAPADPTALRLLNGKSIPVKALRIANGDATPFRTLDLAAPPNAENLVPAVETDPARIWLNTRAKFLALPDLLAARRARDLLVANLRKDPAYAAVAHPKTLRKAAESDEDRLYRKYVTQGLDLPPLRKAADDADSLLAQTETTLRQNAAAIQSATARLDETRLILEEKQTRLRQLEEDLRAATEDDRERAERLRAQHRDLEAQIAPLAEERRKTEARLTELHTQTGDLERARVEHRRRSDAARALLDDRKRTVDAARADYDALRAHLVNLKILEDRLRTETEYHSRNAGAATCLIFVLVGVPLGILSRRGNVILAFAVSFFAVLIVYYPLMFIGQMLARDGHMPPVLAAWMPNLVIGTVGGALLLRGARR